MNVSSVITPLSNWHSDSVMTFIIFLITLNHIIVDVFCFFIQDDVTKVMFSHF